MVRCSPRPWRRARAAAACLLLLHRQLGAHAVHGLRHVPTSPAPAAAPAARPASADTTCLPTAAAAAAAAARERAAACSQRQARSIVLPVVSRGRRATITTPALRSTPRTRPRPLLSPLADPHVRPPPPPPPAPLPARRTTSRPSSRAFQRRCWTTPRWPSRPRACPARPRATPGRAAPTGAALTSPTGGPPPSRRPCPWPWASARPTGRAPRRT
jgi:hypothetical protein